MEEKGPPGEPNPFGDDPMSPALPPTLVDVGLPVGRKISIHSVMYNTPASVFVAVLQPINCANSIDQRVFVRGLTETAYREVALPDELSSVADVVSCAEAPFLFLNVMRWCDRERRAASDLGLYRVMLPTGALEKLPVPNDPLAEPENMSVGAIVGCSVTGAELYLIVSRPAWVRNPPQAGCRMGFFLVRYETTTGAIQMLGDVPAIFA